VNVVHGAELAKLPAGELDTLPHGAAARHLVHDVIDPADTARRRRPIPRALPDAHRHRPGIGWPAGRQVLGAPPLSLVPLSLTWAVGALVIAAACFVQGLAGFGIGLVSLAFLPLLMSPADAIVLITLYATVFTVVIFLPLRRDFTLHGMRSCWWAPSSRLRRASSSSPSCRPPR